MLIEHEYIEVRSNIDDQSPEQLAPLLEDLITLGAADAWLTHILMKKGRPGVQLSVLCTQNSLHLVEEFIFTNTTALGFRYTPVTRHALERRFEEVQTPYGPIKIKLGFYQGANVGYAPEYEDCAKLAKEKGVPLKDVFAEANRAYLNQLSGNKD